MIVRPSSTYVGTAAATPPLPAHPEPIEWAQPITDNYIKAGFSLANKIDHARL